MELKKNPNVDLEKLKGVFFPVGLIVSLAAILIAFNITAKETGVEDLGKVEDMKFEEMDVPVTRVKPPPPQKAPPPKQVAEVLTIVENDTDLDEEFMATDTDVDEDTKIDFIEVKEKKEVAAPEIFYVVETMPVFPGGDAGLRKYIGNNTKYPTIAKETGIEGKVYVRFCVGSDGKISKATILRAVDPSLDKEALRVVKNLPKWKPGEQGGKKVSVWFTVPINFQLQ